MQDTMPLTEESQGMELVWIQPKWSRPQFELRARDTTLASLDWTCGSLALGRWGAAAYCFSRKGWLRPRVLVRSTAQCEADAPLATFETRRGTLTLPDGRAFVWQKPTRLGRVRIWVSDTGTVLARFRAEKHSSIVAVQRAAQRHPELPLLILLGQYLLVQAALDAEAATTAAVIVAASAVG